MSRTLAIRLLFAGLIGIVVIGTLRDEIVRGLLPTYLPDRNAAENLLAVFLFNGWGTFVSSMVALSGLYGLLTQKPSRPEQ